LWTIFSASIHAQLSVEDIYPTYSGNDLGIRFLKDSIQFKVWAPLATECQLLLYSTDHTTEKTSFNMRSSKAGTWVLSMPINVKGSYYTYRVKNVMKGVATWSQEVTDPYSIAAGVNGRRSAIVDLRETNPQGWSTTKASTSRNETVVIYELQIRDASAHKNSGIKHQGKFLGLTEKGTRNSKGQSTGLDHLQELGVTHIHLLPFFDFRSSDESLVNPPYNWGYDPLHYNLPEGTFATTTNDPTIRIKECKEMIMALHKAGLKVVMDVVYNHTALSSTSSFEQLAPNYFYRRNEKGEFSNASACGNETASEQPMMRKFMLESLLFWVKEYQVDGFRFDLMGIHDIETMNLIARELRKIKPNILLYGEGWAAGNSPLAEEQRALKKNVQQLEGIAVFSDEFRDGLKGSVFIPTQKGFVSGDTSRTAGIKFGLRGGWGNPAQMIAYADCHDNHTLWDKLFLSAPTSSSSELISMNKLALTLVLTSQGIPFLHAGSEFLRSKKGVENSFESPDSINAIDWDLKFENAEVFSYVKKLIELRKRNPEFWNSSTNQEIYFKEFEKDANGLLSYLIVANSKAPQSSKLQILFNGSGEEIWIDKFALQDPNGHWSKLAANNVFLEKSIPLAKEDTLKIAPFSATIMMQKNK
jgi:pullulanase